MKRPVPDTLAQSTASHIQQKDDRYPIQGGAAPASGRWGALELDPTQTLLRIS